MSTVRSYEMSLDPGVVDSMFSPAQPIESRALTTAEKVQDILNAFNYMRVTIGETVKDAIWQEKILRKLASVEASATRAATMQREALYATEPQRKPTTPGKPPAA